VTILPDDGPRPRRARRTIGLWGAPGSGKTTFLAALYTAMARSRLDISIVGSDEESTDFLIKNNTMLHEHRFPSATQVVTSYSWDVNATGAHRPAGRPGAASITPVQFSIDLKDAPGKIHENQSGPMEPDVELPPVGLAGRHELDGEDMMDYLASCNGLLLLVDPVREQKSGDTNEYFQGTMLKIAQRGRRPGSASLKLPHYVAVCITKFDHPEVYGFARRHSFRTYRDDDAYQFPRVHSKDAEDFFRELGKSTDRSDADLICNALGKYFEPERVQYFVTSAIGFYCNGTRFREEDRDNIIDQPGGKPQIRGQIYPINVLEPILWLGQNIATV
jgi:hypothetical protein